MPKIDPKTNAFPSKLGKIENINKPKKTEAQKCKPNKTNKAKDAT